MNGGRVRTDVGLARFIRAGLIANHLVEIMASRIQRLAGRVRTIYRIVIGKCFKEAFAGTFYARSCAPVMPFVLAIDLYVSFCKTV